MTSGFGIGGRSLEAPLTALAELQRKGMLKHIALSNVTPTQLAQGRAIADIVWVHCMCGAESRPAPG